MNPRILFVSQYGDPNLIGGNNNVYRQAQALKNAHGVDVEILTWPYGDRWSGPLPVDDESGGVPQTTWCYEGLKYHVVKLPGKLVERVLSDSDWEQAVAIGCDILRRINPTIVHLQHWRGLWWILESANKLSIPTVYTAHDWGIGCLRTILVKGEGGLCDGVVDVDKCVQCISKGRNPIGRANELLVSTPIGEWLVEMLDTNASVEGWLSSHGAVRMGLRNRVPLNYKRAKAVLASLSAIIVPNSFAKTFYLQFGISESRIVVQPWYYDLSVPVESSRVDHSKTILGYIGRISPEKGVKRIFEALLSDSIAQPIHLVIAGEIAGDYAKQLHSKFQHSVGKHSVEWMGWIPHHDVHKFYQKVDAVIISSEWIENGPLTLIESFAFKRPVIVTDTPTVRDLVQQGQTGYLTAFASTESLSQVISRVSENPNDLLEMRSNIPTVTSSIAYARVIKDIYESIDCRERRNQL